MPRVFIDCTETFLSGHRSGIQRVVREIVKRTDVLENELGIPFVPVLALGGHFYPLARFGDLGENRSLRTVLLENAKTLYHRLDRVWKRIRPCRGDGSGEPSRPQAQAAGHPSVRALIKQKGRNAFLWLASSRLRLRAGDPLRPEAGDRLLMPDIFWGTQDPLKAAKNFSDGGGEVLLLVHDLIPLRFPQFCHEGTVYGFKAALPQALALSRRVFTVSRSVQEDLERYLSESRPDWPGRVESVFLGADLPKRTARVETVRESFQTWGGDRPFFLMVGSFQPHKGHLIALAAFEKLWREGCLASLLMLGRVGGRGEEIVGRIRESSHFGTSLLLVDDANDAELEFLYERTKGVIMASFAEGFGLPLVEALNRGVPVVASDLAVFREVAGESPEYFIPGDSDDLARAVRHLDRRELRTPAASRASMTWRTWDEAAMNLGRRILETEPMREKGG